MIQSAFNARRAAALALVLVLLGSGAGASGQQRRQQRRRPAQAPAAKRPAAKRPPSVARRTPPAAARRATGASAADARMTGVYLLNAGASADPQLIAERVTSHLPPEERERAVEELVGRLSPPGQIAIRRRGRAIDIASTRAPRISFEADGATHDEVSADGRPVRTRAVLYGDSLMVSSRGGPDDEFSVSFDSINGGRRLRITRRIHEPRLGRPVVVQSVYDKTSAAARFSIYGEPVPAAVASARGPRRRPQPQSQPPQQQQADVRARPQPQQPPVIRRPPPAPPRREEVEPYGGFHIDEGARFDAVLDFDLTTENARAGDAFRMTVRGPAGFEGALIEGRVASVERGGRVAGRAGLQLEFERIRLPDGRTQEFAAIIEDVRPAGGEEVRVDSEASGSVEEGDSQTDRTVQRTAIGAAVGAIIGAIAGGGKGAVIGAAVGAGAGAGSVYAQGRDRLELLRGTEMTLRATRR
jgi:YMGG-like Gly-zipper